MEEEIRKTEDLKVAQSSVLVTMEVDLDGFFSFEIRRFERVENVDCLWIHTKLESCYRVRL